VKLNPAWFGGFPGARFIGAEEREALSEVVAARSPYRFYGIELLGKAEALEGFCRGAFKRRHALALSSGTAALHAALHAVGVGAGDEVVLPAYAWSSDLMAVLALGGVPVIAPLDETLGLDPASLRSCLTDRTKAVIAVHMRGYPCDLGGISAAVRGKGVRVIEDGAQCLGGAVDGKEVGTGGDVAVLSFQYNKLVTSGEGGMLLTDDPGFHERAYRFHDLGMLRKGGEADPEGETAIGSLGLNYRVSELQAAFLLPQLKRKDQILAALGKVHDRVMEALTASCAESGLEERLLPHGGQSNRAFFCLRADSADGARLARETLCRQGAPFQSCARLDGHHFQVWRHYLKRERRPSRIVEGDRSEELLRRHLFVELNPLPV
jgi:8-amino-3,8-dideoxy-alpha-D-manno-octulosonate transaminase